MLIMRMFFRNTSIFLCLICLFTSICSCAGLSDWGYRLPNGYEISRCNNIDICLIEDQDGDGGGSIIIDTHIKYFCYNDTYVGIKQIPLVCDEIIVADFDSDDYDENSIVYFLLDTATKEIYGPYTKEEYTKQCTALHIESMCEWIDTKTKPSGEIHEKYVH